MTKRNKGLLDFFSRMMLAGSAVLAGAALTVVFFLLLPLLQKMGRPPESGMEVRTVEAAVLQPPPPPPPEEDKKEEEPPEEPPPAELTEQAASPLDLSQLELALDPGFGDGVGAGVLAAGRLGAGGRDAGHDEEAEAIFSLADLDQAPKAISQSPPQYPAALRSQKVRGTVHVLFVVDRNGRVASALVQTSTHSAFERPALEAVRQWRFEPGKRGGQTVQFRMRVPITFSCG